MAANAALRYRRSMDTVRHSPVGSLLRSWRERRRMSQLALACEAEVSTRHLSFVETGRSTPSRELLLQLAEHLEVPLRERNVLLTAAGYAPVYGERGLDDPALRPAREAVDLVLAGHEPYPALAIDRRWNLVAHNPAIGRLLLGVAPDLLTPPVNVLRLSLHPEGMAARIANLAQWRAHLLARLRRDIELSADAALIALQAELERFPAPPETSQALGSRSDERWPMEAGGRVEPTQLALGSVVVPLQLRTGAGLLSFISTTTVFGTPLDVTLSELALESFFPADAATAQALRLSAEHTESSPPTA
jgi:transcriptional regulator with XRE-family HTH domain